MTTASYPWKQLLLRQAEALHALAQPHRWSEASSVKLEETAVLGFYAVRRLVNAFLLSDAVIHRPIPMQAFPAHRRKEVMLGDESFDVLYDLKAGRAVAHDLLFLCHQAIHNCVFAPYFGPDNALQGIYLTSDHQRKVALYGVELKTLQDLFRQIGTEH